MTSTRDDLNDKIATTKKSPSFTTSTDIKNFKSKKNSPEEPADLYKRESFLSTFLQELAEAENEPLNINISDENDNEDEDIDEVDNEERDLNESYIEDEEETKEITQPTPSNQTKPKWLFTPAKQTYFNDFLTPNMTKTERPNIKSFFSQVQDKNRVKSKESIGNFEGEKESKKSLFLPHDDKITNYNFANRKLSSNLHKLNHERDVIYEDEGEIDNTGELCKKQEAVGTPLNGPVVNRFGANQGTFSRLKSSFGTRGGDVEYTPLNTKSFANVNENPLKINSSFESENKENSKNVSIFDENDSLKFSSSNLLPRDPYNEKILFSSQKINKDESSNRDLKENTEGKEDLFKNVNRDIFQTPLNKNLKSQEIREQNQLSLQKIYKKDVHKDEDKNNLENKENSSQNKSFELFKNNFQTPSNQISKTQEITNQKSFSSQKNHKTNEDYPENKQNQTASNQISKTQEITNQKSFSSQKNHKTNEDNPENKQNSSENPPKILCTIPVQKSLQTFDKIIVNKIEYVILNQIGRGGSSIVYHCYDILQKCERAIKKVTLTGDKLCVQGYINEVKMLHKLQKCNRIIKMFSFEIVDRKVLYMVLEKGERDLSQILKELSNNTDHLPLYMLIYYFMEMLYAVQQIHENGIIHSDLKPANFLMISSKLKLIDFGIASSLQNDMTSVVKTVQIGSFNYISPEALSNENRDAGVAKFKISYKSDVWSLGCILYQLIYKKTPFQHIGHPYAKLSAIIDPKHVIEYPEVSWVPANIIEILKSCLLYDIKSRPSVNEIMAGLEKLYY